MGRRRGSVSRRSGSCTADLGRSSSPISAVPVGERRQPTLGGRRGCLDTSHGSITARTGPRGGDGSTPAGRRTPRQQPRCDAVRRRAAGQHDSAEPGGVGEHRQLGPGRRPGRGRPDRPGGQGQRDHPRHHLGQRRHGAVQGHGHQPDRTALGDSRSARQLQPRLGQRAHQGNGGHLRGLLHGGRGRHRPPGRARRRRPARRRSQDRAPPSTSSRTSEAAHPKGIRRFTTGLGADTCTSRTNVSVCGVVILPKGIGSPNAALATGSCTDVLCTGGKEVQFIAGLTDAAGANLYSRTNPATLVLQCDKSKCAGRGVSFYTAKLSLSATGPADRGSRLREQGRHAGGRGLLHRLRREPPRQRRATC